MGIFDLLFGPKQTQTAPAEPAATSRADTVMPEPAHRASPTQSVIAPSPVPVPGPTFNGRTVPYYPSRGLGVLAAPPDYLIQTQEKLIREIKQASSLSYDEFDAFILPVIKNYARFVHLLPASETDHHSDLGGLFRHGLEVALIACRRAEALEFGLNENPSIRKFQVFRWRACALLGGMLHDLGKAVIDVGAVDHTGKVIWNPHILPLWDWIEENRLEYYYVSWNPHRKHREHDNISATVIAKLMPIQTMRWMGEYNGRVPYDAMLLALGHAQTRDNPLIDLIHKADMDSTARDSKESNRRMASVGEGGTRGLSARYTRAIRDNIASSNWRINTPGGIIWHTTEGLFAIMPAIVTKIEEYMREKGDDAGLPADVVSIAQNLADAGHIEASITAKGTPKHVFEVIIEGSSDKGGAGVLVKHKVIKFVNEIVIPDYFDLPAPVVATLLDDDGKPITHGGVVKHDDDTSESTPQAPDTAKPKATQKPKRSKAGKQAQDEQELTVVDDVMDEDRTPIVSEEGFSEEVLSQTASSTAPEAAPQRERDPSHQQGEKPSELRDRAKERDARDVVIDEGIADASKPFPPVRSEDAIDWLKSEDMLGQYMLYVIHRMEEGEAKWDEQVVIQDERLYLRYPDIFEDSGMNPATVMSNLFSAEWIEKGPGQTGIPMKVKFGGVNAHALRFSRDHTTAMQLVLPKAKSQDKPKVMGPYLQEGETMLLVGNPEQDGWIYRKAFHQFLSDKHKDNGWDGDIHSADPTLLYSLVRQFAKAHSISEKFLSKHLQQRPYPLLSGGESMKKLTMNPSYDPFKDEVMHTSKGAAQ